MTPRTETRGKRHRISPWPRCHVCGHLIAHYEILVHSGDGHAYHWTCNEAIISRWLPPLIPKPAQGIQKPSAP